MSPPSIDLPAVGLPAIDRERQDEVTTAAARIAKPVAVVAGAVAAVAASVLAVTGVVRTYAAYRRDHEAAYAAVAPTEHYVAHTPVGDVEYRDRGTGTPVLVSHGIVGGCDQAIQTGTSLVDDARVIAPSRFGYLGSDVPHYPTPSAQSRAFAELLDDVDVDDAVILGTSAGAPAAIRFALAFPERTRGLVLLAAATPGDDDEDTGEDAGASGPPAVALRDPVFWLLRSRAPWLLRRMFGVSRSDWATAMPAERDRVDALFETLFPVAPRREGVAIDTEFTNPRVVDHADEFDPSDLAVPTLVVHAEDDPLADFAHATWFAEHAPDGTLRAYETGGHLVFGHGDDVAATVTAFAHDPDAYVKDAVRESNSLGDDTTGLEPSSTGDDTRNPTL